MTDNRYTVGSLFAGIGGIDLGLERTGYFRTAWVCERDPYCQRVLAKHWPDVPVYDDVAGIGEDTPAVDVIAAGFPCQPVSTAGRRKAQDDERWLWPHVERCIGVLRPRGVLLENVAGLFTAGFDDVIGGLAACGYAAEWDCIPAAAVGAPHRRDRVFLVAARPDVANVTPQYAWPSPMGDSACIKLDSERANNGIPSRTGKRPGPVTPAGGASVMEDANSARPHRAISEIMAGPAGFGGGSDTTRPSSQGTGAPMANTSGVRQSGQGQPIHRSGAAQDKDRETSWAFHDGQPPKWATEPSVGRVANGVPRRVDRLRALGNAVVPQVAEYVGHQLARVMGGENA